MRITGSVGLKSVLRCTVHFRQQFQNRRGIHSAMVAQQPINLVSVNTAPDRAKKVIGQVIENVSGKYSIVHAGNSES